MGGRRLVFDQAIRAFFEVDGEEPEARGEGAPFVVIEERPVEVADERNAIVDDLHHFVDVQAQKIAAPHAVAPPGTAIVRAAAQGHAIFRDEHRTLKILRVEFAEKVEPARKHAPVPPFARDGGEHPRAERLVLEFVIPKDRQAKDVRGKRIVIIEPDVIERPAGAARRRDRRATARNRWLKAAIARASC